MPLFHYFLCFFLLFLFFFFPSASSARPLRNSTDEISNFLKKYGYLSKPNTDFKSAVSLYQSNHGLAVTGRLDRPTLAQISTPRCGVSDDRLATTSHFAYFPGQPRWTKPSPITLTYALSPNNSINYISQSQLHATMQRAFSRWAQVIPIRFMPARDYDSANVKLGFYYGDHGDGEAFDGVLGVLAHGFSPESGRLHLDKAETWAVDFEAQQSDVAVDLESVMTHEIGHVLGLGHSAVRDAVMFPSLSPRTKKAELSVDDVEGVQALYGSNPNFQMSSVLESDTSGSVLDPARGGLGMIGVYMVGFCFWLLSNK